MAYYRGDYYVGVRGRYAGDYYRGRGAGDPFWGALWTGIKTVGSALLGVRPAAPMSPPLVPGGQVGAASASGGLSGVASALQAGAGALMRVPPITPITKTRVPSPAELPPPMALMPSHLVGVGGRRRRRMNPANPRALRRSIRRVISFGRLAMGARRSVSKAATALQCNRRTTRAVARRR